MQDSGRFSQEQSPSMLQQLAAFVILVAGMRAASAIVVPFLLAVFVAIICAPLFLWMRQRGWPPVLASIVVVLLLLVLGGGVIGLVVKALEGFASNLPTYQDQLESRRQALLEWLGERRGDAFQEFIAGSWDTEAMVNAAGNLVASATNLLSNTFLIILTILFLLLESAGIPQKLRSLPSRNRRTAYQLNQVVERVRNYMAIKACTSGATGILIFCGLYWLGIDYPLLWAILAFFFNFVPNIGSFIAAFPALVLAFLQDGSSGLLWAGGIYLAVNIVIGNLIEPRVMGHGLGLSTLVVFLSLIFWSWVLGPFGMLLSVPLTMFVKSLLEHHEGYEGLALLLGEEESGKP